MEYGGTSHKKRYTNMGEGDLIKDKSNILTSNYILNIMVIQ